MKGLLSTFFILFSTSALAQGAQEFEDLVSLQSQSFYRLTCSNVADHPQTHFYGEFTDQRLTILKILIIYPGFSLQVRELTSKDLEDFAVKVNAQELKIEGTWRSDSYWSESFNMLLRDKPTGLAGSVTYNDGDNLNLERDVKCSALNYILTPAG